MANFIATLSIPAGTTLVAPARQELVTVAGQLLALRLYVPPGPRGEVYLRLMWRGVQIAPARIGTWWRPNDAILTHPLDQVVSKGDAVFYLEGASPNANFVHAIDFELLVAPAQVQGQSLSTPSLIDRITSLFGG